MLDLFVFDKVASYSTPRWPLSISHMLETCRISLWHYSANRFCLTLFAIHSMVYDIDDLMLVHCETNTILRYKSACV
jgi:hypothetical protein